VTWRVFAAAAAALCVMAPRIAQACPSCAGREDGGVGRIVLLGLMIVLPFFIAYIVYRVIRFADAQANRIERVP